MMDTASVVTVGEQVTHPVTTIGLAPVSWAVATRAVLLASAATRVSASLRGFGTVKLASAGSDQHKGRRVPPSGAERFNPPALRCARGRPG